MLHFSAPAKITHPPCLLGNLVFAPKRIDLYACVWVRVSTTVSVFEWLGVCVCVLKPDMVTPSVQMAARRSGLSLGLPDICRSQRATNATTMPSRPPTAHWQHASAASLSSRRLCLCVCVRRSVGQPLPQPPLTWQAARRCCCCSFCCCCRIPGHCWCCCYSCSC